MSSTTKSQRIGIWIIAVVLMIGTVGSFFAIVFANNNSSVDQVAAQKAQAECQTEETAYTNKVNAQADQLSSQYYSTLQSYANQVSSFNAADVKSVTSQDLKAGDGATIDDKTAYSAYYIGWNPSGKIFDESIKSGKLQPPIPGQGLIEGWSEGVNGMKLGGVREITISSDKAYGSQGSGDDIPPNTPIKFIVLAIPSPPTIEQPACATSAAATGETTGQ